ncbi:MAG: protein kinase [Deltaproteobacteria bacterium]|nr:protein kinase [Deltaproteobacteria bacterium]
MSKQLLYAYFAHKNGMISNEQLDKIQGGLKDGTVSGKWEEIENTLSLQEKQELDSLVDKTLQDNKGNLQATLQMFVATSPADKEESIAQAETLAAPQELDLARMPTLESDEPPLTKSTDAPQKNLNLQESGLGVSKEESGRYRITGEIGKGGIGRVLLGFDKHIGREIAFKELINAKETKTSSGKRRRKRTQLTADANTRFLREARITGQLEHPSIVPVYEIGKKENSGSFYYTMKLIRGKTLKQAIDEASSLKARLLLLPHFRDLCQAIAFAHNKDVIHRDIKPGNIMIGEFGETVVLDWGLAKIKGQSSQDKKIAKGIQDLKPLNLENTEKTRQGSTLGTPAYMPPEQALGKIDEIDHRSDIYSLGAVLYQILTGKPPFQGKMVQTVLMNVVEKEPVSPTEIHQEIPSELEAVALKSLQKKPDNRYQSASELAHDIESYMSGEKVAAHDYTSMDLLKRFIQRNKALVGTLSTITIIIIISLIFTTWSYRREREAKKQEAAARIKTDKAKQKMELANKQMRIERRKSNFHIAQALMEKSFKRDKKNDTAASAIFASASLHHNPVSKQSPFFNSSASINFPEGKHLNSLARGKILLANLNPPPGLLASDRFNSTLNNVVLSHNGKYAAAGFFNGKIVFVDYANNKKKIIKTSLNAVWAMSLNNKGDKVAVSGDGMEILVYALKTGKLIKSFSLMMERYPCLKWSRDDKWLIYSSTRGYVTKVNYQDFEKVKPVGKRIGTAVSMALSKDGNYLATGSIDGKIHVKNFKTGELLKIFNADQGGVVWSLAFSKTSNLLVSGSFDGNIRVWNLNNDKPVSILRGEGKPVWRIIFYNDKDWIISGGGNKNISIWNLAENNLELSLEAHGDLIHDLSLSHNNNKLVTASYDKNLKLWDLSKPKKIKIINHHKDSILDVAFSSDNRFLISSSNDHQTCIYSLENNKKVSCITGHRFGGNSLSNLYVVRDGNLVHWNGLTGKITSIYKGRILCTNLSPDGKILAAGSFTGKIKLFSNDGKKINVLKGHDKKITQILFGKNGKILFSSSLDGKVIIWKIKTGKIMGTLKHKDWVTGLALSENQKFIYTCGKDPIIRKWNLKTLKAVQKFPGHNQWVNRIALSPDNKHLASSSDDGSVKIWSTQTGELLFSFKTKVSVGLKFTPDGKILALSDFNKIKLIILDFSILHQNPLQIKNHFQQLSGLKLKGIKIYPLQTPFKKTK